MRSLKYGCRLGLGWPKNIGPRLTPTEQEHTNGRSGKNMVSLTAMPIDGEPSTNVCTAQPNVDELRRAQYPTENILGRCERGRGVLHQRVVVD